MNNALIKLTNEFAKECGKDVWVTLSTGGQLINGIICSWAEYSKHHPITDKFNEALSSDTSNISHTKPSNDFLENSDCFIIYLKSAKFHDVSTGNSFPSIGIFFAVNSNYIHGFSFGQIVNG